MLIWLFHQHNISLVVHKKNNQPNAYSLNLKPLLTIPMGHWEQSFSPNAFWQTRLNNIYIYIRLLSHSLTKNGLDTYWSCLGLGHPGENGPRVASLPRFSIPSYHTFMEITIFLLIFSFSQRVVHTYSGHSSRSKLVQAQAFCVVAQSHDLDIYLLIVHNNLSNAPGCIFL